MALQSLTTDARNPVLGRIGQPPALDVPGLPHLNELGADIGVGRTNELGAALPPIQDTPIAPIVAPPLSPLEQRKAQIEADLQHRTNPTKPTSVLGKIGHGFAVAGNILGDMFAPSTMALIPGTQLNNEKKIAQDKADLGGISDLQTQEVGRKATQASADFTEQRPDIEMAKLKQGMDKTLVRADQAAAKAGQKRSVDAEGNVTYVDDPASAAYQSRKIHDDTEKARQDYLDAQQEVDNLKNDPNSPLYKLAVTRAQTAKANAGAAIQRAQAYYGNYLMHSKGTDLGGNPLNGIGMLDGESVGTSVQPTVTKALQGGAQFADVNQGLQHTNTALEDLDKEGGSLNDAALVAALQDPTHSATEWAQGKVNANLTPAELNAVVAIKAMRERILAMRKASGGNASEGQVQRMLALLPGPQTPTLDMAKRQLKEVQSQADVLGGGVPQIHHNAAPNAPKIKKFNPTTGRLE